jgi:hypothetical protein
MLFHCFTGCSTVMYKQDVNNKIFGPLVKSCNDYALFLQVLQHMHNARGYSECFTKYRIRQKSLSRNKIDKIKPYFTVIHTIEHKNILAACFFLLTNQLIKFFWKYERT